MSRLLLVALVTLASCRSVPDYPKAICTTDAECEALTGEPVNLDPDCIYSCTQPSGD